MEWTDFYLTNALVLIIGIAQAELAPALALAPLAFAALMLINATFFHVLPFIRTRGRFSPGIVTAIFIFYPLGIGEFAKATAERRLSFGIAIGAFAIGARLDGIPYRHAEPESTALLSSNLNLDLYNCSAGYNKHGIVTYRR